MYELEFLVCCWVGVGCLGCCDCCFDVVEDGCLVFLVFVFGECFFLVSGFSGGWFVEDCESGEVVCDGGGGGEMVPAVMCVVVSVVRVGSMSVGVLWTGSYLVGVVIVVCRLFVVRRLVKGWRGRRLKRLMLWSPWSVISVLGLDLRIVLMACWMLFWMFLSRSGWSLGFCGLL